MEKTRKKTNRMEDEEWNREVSGMIRNMKDVLSNAKEHANVSKEWVDQFQCSETMLGYFSREEKNRLSLSSKSLCTTREILNELEEKISFFEKSYKKISDEQSIKFISKTGRLFRKIMDELEEVNIFLKEKSAEVYNWKTPKRDM